MKGPVLHGNGTAAIVGSKRASFKTSNIKDEAYSSRIKV
jgi:hypothetical protein